MRQYLDIMTKRRKLFLPGGEDFLGRRRIVRTGVARSRPVVGLQGALHKNSPPDWDEHAPYWTLSVLMLLMPKRAPKGRTSPARQTAWVRERLAVWPRALKGRMSVLGSTRMVVGADSWPLSRPVKAGKLEGGKLFDRGRWPISAKVVIQLRPRNHARPG